MVFPYKEKLILHSYVVFSILQPLPETIALVEDIVVEYVTDLVSLFCVSMILSSVLSAERLIVRLCE